VVVVVVVVVVLDTNSLIAIDNAIESLMMDTIEQQKDANAVLSSHHIMCDICVWTVDDDDCTINKCVSKVVSIRSINMIRIIMEWRYYND